MSKILMVDLAKCTGCRMCELVCSMKHHGEYNPAKSRINVGIFTAKAFFIPIYCIQCDDAFCARICPSGAITTEKVNGISIVKISEEKCAGCKMCMLACPFGNINFISEKHYAQKCDFCDGEPECVDFCVTGALMFKEAEVSIIHRKKTVADKIKEAYKEVKL